MDRLKLPAFLAPLSLPIGGKPDGDCGPEPPLPPDPLPPPEAGIRPDVKFFSLSFKGLVLPAAFLSAALLAPRPPLGVLLPLDEFAILEADAPLWLKLSPEPVGDKGGRFPTAARLLRVLPVA